MMTVLATALGTAFGVIGIYVSLRPATPSLRAALVLLEQDLPSSRLPADAAAPSGWIRVDQYLADRLGALVSEVDWIRVRLWPLFAITGMSVQKFFADVILCASVGAVLPAAWWMMVGIAGVHVSFIAPLWAGLLFGSGGALLPVLALHSRAKRARLFARKVVGSYLNLVVLCLAGGMGIEGALHASARIGLDHVSERILNALVLAQDAGEPPWDGLGRLGREFGMTELTELAAAVGLAGKEGARIRATLAAKASSIRRHNLTDAESEANTVTERLFLPGVCLLVGFLAFIAYPAVARISTGL